MLDDATPSTPSTPSPMTLYGVPFERRLLLGTARYPSLATLLRAIEVSRPAMITVALRRQMAGFNAAPNPGADADGRQDGAAAPQGADFYAALRRTGVPLLPNTAGCQSVDEAVTTAQMARELFDTDWVKLELIGDDVTLQPDSVALIEAARILIDDGFRVLPYCTEDLVVARRLMDAGCQALMPWAAPIGTGRGVANPYAMRQLRDRLPPELPLIVDAGLGVPSHACQVMEWGFDAVLLNTAVSQADDPVRMAAAFAAAVDAGRMAWQAGPMPVRDAAQASTPMVGMPFWHQAGA
ncbi:thiazole synthase [Robbsia sp. KACC 23696]|uniref:thiazole synthase n=1 Tax=Robbsia sp. KACC 23696 TaxID=3149231 RepID=UPI00325B9037